MSTPDTRAATVGEAAAAATPGEAMTPARPPVGVGTSPLFGLLIALALIALGVTGVQEALVRSGAMDGTSWTTWVLTNLDSVRAAFWVLVVSVAAVVAGLALLLVAVRRRPRKALEVQADTGVYLRTRDLARVADDLIEGTDGVTDVKSSASRRRLRVTITTVGSKDRNPDLTAAVRDQLAPCLTPLASAPKVVVTIRNEDLI